MSHCRMVMRQRSETRDYLTRLRESESTIWSCSVVCNFKSSVSQSISLQIDSSSKAAEQQVGRQVYSECLSKRDGEEEKRGP